MLSLIKAEDKVICNSVSILLAPRNTIKMLIIFCRLLDIGVAEVMEPHLWKPNLSDYLLKILVKCKGSNVFAQIVCEYQIVRIAPA